MTLVATALAQIARVVSGASVRWSGTEPAPGCRIYFANHTSHLDFLVLWSALPPALRVQTRPVAAADYWESGRLRRYLVENVANAVLVGRGGDRQTVVQAKQALAAALDAGTALIIFPEGTRGTGPEIAPFKSGLYYLARERPEVDLVPVHIDNLNRIWPKGELFPIPMLSTITFGPSLHIGDDESKIAFLKRARASVEALRPQ